MDDDRSRVILGLRRSLRENPRRVRTLVALGQALSAQGLSDEAEIYWRRALAVCPYEPQALLGLAGLLQLQGRYDDAMTLAQAALSARPNSGEGWLTLGDSLFNAGRAAEAITAYEKAASSEGVGFDALVRLGKARRVLGNVDGALAAFAQAMSLRPDSAVPFYERGLLKLEQGDFGTGWTDYEARWRSDRFLEGPRGLVPLGLVPLLATAPTFETVAGKRVLLIGEQGIGDQLMFASMLPDLSRAAASVVCLCEPRLMRLFAASFPGVTFVHPSGAQVDSETVDVLLAMGSLGCAFRTGLDRFPGAAYVRPTEAQRLRWAARLGPRTGRLRVGVSWRGGTPATNRLERSIDLKSLAPVLDHPDCEFISLQYGEVAEEIEAANASRRSPIRFFPTDDLHDFDDFAALIANLDVVVSVQTAAVHLAGALGKRCLALISNKAEWRYMRQGTSLPWYRSVQLLRQARPADWSGVLEAAAAALQSMATSAADLGTEAQT